MRRTGIKQKRDKPRRNDGRVQHQRMKPKESAPPTAAEKRHMGRVAKLPCLVPGCMAQTNLHHVHSDGMKRLARLHKRIVPLCRWHHQDGLHAVHVIGHAEFNRLYQVDLLEIADRLWGESHETDRGHAPRG